MEPTHERKKERFPGQGTALIAKAANGGNDSALACTRNGVDCGRVIHLTRETSRKRHTGAKALGSVCVLREQRNKAYNRSRGASRSAQPSEGTTGRLGTNNCKGMTATHTSAGGSYIQLA